jgi:hypothetical protein
MVGKVGWLMEAAIIFSDLTVFPVMLFRKRYLRLCENDCCEATELVFMYDKLVTST